MAAEDELNMGLIRPMCPQVIVFDCGGGEYIWWSKVSLAFGVMQRTAVARMAYRKEQEMSRNDRDAVLARTVLAAIADGYQGGRCQDGNGGHHDRLGDAQTVLLAVDICVAASVSLNSNRPPPHGNENDAQVRRSHE